MNVEAWRSFTSRLNFVDLIPAKKLLDECSLDDVWSMHAEKSIENMIIFIIHLAAARTDM